MNEEDRGLIANGWRWILKALLFDGGPSSTRWVYLLAAVSVSAVLLMMGAAFAWVYAWKHTADLVMAGAIAATVTALIGFASNSQNTKNIITGNVNPEDHDDDHKDDHKDDHRDGNDHRDNQE